MGQGQREERDRVAPGFKTEYEESSAQQARAAGRRAAVALAAHDSRPGSRFDGNADGREVPAATPDTIKRNLEEHPQGIWRNEAGGVDDVEYAHQTSEESSGHEAQRQLSRPHLP